MVQKSNVNGGAWLCLMMEAGDRFNERKPISSDLLIFGRSHVIFSDRLEMINGLHVVESQNPSVSKSTFF